MKKDFQKWNQIKEKINDTKNRPNFHESEIWFASIGLNIGYEADGKGDDFLRPILILKKFNNCTFWAVSLTTTNKNNRHLFAFYIKGYGKSKANLSQLKLIDALRLKYCIGSISLIDFNLLKKHIVNLIQQCVLSNYSLSGDGPKP